MSKDQRNDSNAKGEGSHAQVECNEEWTDFPHVSLLKAYVASTATLVSGSYMEPTKDPWCNNSFSTFLLTSISKIGGSS